MQTLEERITALEAQVQELQNKTTGVSAEAVKNSLLQAFQDSSSFTISNLESSA